jgi:hypothetical protein
MSVVTIAEGWPAAGHPFTVAELDRMPDDGRRYELLDGVLVVSPRPTTIHQFVAAGQGLKIRVREGTRDCVQVDDVPDHEAVMPGARLQAYSVLERQSPNTCPRFYPHCDIAGSQRLLQ